MSTILQKGRKGNKKASSTPRSKDVNKEEVAWKAWLSVISIHMLSSVEFLSLLSHHYLNSEML